MDYKLYEIEDFVADESYLRYYFKLNNADIIFWKNWISTHPEKLDVIVNADQLINFLFLQLPEEEFQKECERMQEAITPVNVQAEQVSANDFPDNNYSASSNISIIFKQHRFLWSVAASVLLIISMCIIYFSKNTKNDNAIALEILGKEKNTEKNDTKLCKKLQLEDGTIVTLQPGAELIYPAHFLNDKREVYLTGEAFFEVSKNAKRPFFVYNNNLVTHVLGTSFNVKIDKDKKEVEVSVRTGRVEVSERIGRCTSTNADAHVKSNGVVLTPNQKVIYKQATKNFETTLVDVPLPVKHETTKQNKVISQNANMETLFTEAPISGIIKSLGNAYGISIEVENDNINTCHFTGDISNSNFFEKLDILCKAIDAGYEIKGTKIIIRGKGCD